MKLSSKGVYTTGISSNIIEVNQKTIINYENAGLIKITKNQNGRRLFSQKDLFQILFIRWLIQEKGLNMKGVKMVIDILDSSAKKSEDIYKLVLPKEVEKKILKKISLN